MSQRVHTTIKQPQVQSEILDESQVVTTSASVTERVRSAQRSRVTEVIYAGSPGPAGPEGLQGIQGPPGDPGSAAQAYVHTQNTPSTDWVIQHNLGYHPSIEIYDSAGTNCETDITHVDANTALSHADAAFSGLAYCS